jgi:hypothetical protein
MSSSTGAFARDANRVPITLHGVQLATTETFAGTGTLHIPLFSVTGTIEVYALYGIVTTALGSNVTAAYWRSWDQTAAVAISLATGTILSSASVGSHISRGSVASVALTLSNSSAAKVLDPVAATAPDVYMPFTIVQKTGGVLTEIEFVYTTNNNSAGSIQFVASYVPISSDGDLNISTTAIY